MIFENDEVDVAMMCMLDEKSEEEADSIIESDISALDESEDISELNTMDIALDDSDVDPIGSEAEDIIDSEQELLLGDGDGDLIDMVASSSEEEE